MRRAHVFRAYPTRPQEGRAVMALQLKQEHRRWYVIVIAETEPTPLPATGGEVGVDVGVARFLTASDGEVVDNPRFLAASADVIADLERRKSRARPGSVICPACGPMDADLNGAINIASRAGLGSGHAAPAA